MGTIEGGVNSARYVSERRKVVVRKSLVSAVTDGVAGASDRVQEGIAEILVDLGPEAGNMDVDDIRLRVEMIVPYVLEQHGARYHLARVLHQIFEEEELAGLQHNRFARARHLVRQAVEHEVAHGK